MTGDLKFLCETSLDHIQEVIAGLFFISKLRLPDMKGTSFFAMGSSTIVFHSLQAGH